MVNLTKWYFVLDELECEIFIISPIREGFAVIGSLDVYNPPAGILDVKRGKNEIRISVYERGRYAFYCDFEPSKVEGAKKWWREDSILKVDT